MLAIGEHRRVFLVSAPGSVGRLLDPLSVAVADLGAGEGMDRADAPVLLVLAKESFRAHESALKSGRPENFRILGQTARPELALAACDVAVAPFPAWRGGFEHAASGRFIADALAFGRPVAALRGASGADLLRSGDESGHAPGIIVERGSPADWLRALRMSMDADWFLGASGAAAAIGLGFRPQALLETLDAELREAARSGSPAASAAISL